MDGQPETLGELGRRVNAVEQEIDELRELVDGQESWSHRKRLHRLENERQAAELVRKALEELQAVRSNRWTRAREWASFAIAAAAIVVAILARHHGAG